MPIPIDSQPVMSFEERIACAIVVNTSADMAPCAQRLQDAVVELVDAINGDDYLRNHIDLCLITYDNDPRVVQPFSPPHFFELPHFTHCKGIASTHKAIRFAIDTINDRKAVYRDNCISYLQPWIVFLSNGQTHDADNGSFDELMQLQNLHKLSFYPVVIGPDATISELRSMHKDAHILRTLREEYAAAFASVLVRLDEYLPPSSAERDPPFDLPCIFIE